MSRIQLSPNINGGNDDGVLEHEQPSPFLLSWQRNRCRNQSVQKSPVSLTDVRTMQVSSKSSINLIKQNFYRREQNELTSSGGSPSNEQLDDYHVLKSCEDLQLEFCSNWVVSIAKSSIRFFSRTRSWIQSVSERR